MYMDRPSFGKSVYSLSSSQEPSQCLLFGPRIVRDQKTTSYTERKTTYSVTCHCYMFYLYSCSISGSFWIRGSLVPGIPGQSLICDLDLDRSRVCRRVAKVHQSHRGGARVRMRVRSHWGRAAWLRQSCGSGSGQRELHVRLSVASLHFVFSFFQHRGLKMKCLWNFYIDTLASFILRYYLKLLYKFTLNLILVFNRQ